MLGDRATLRLLARTPRSRDQSQIALDLMRLVEALHLIEGSDKRQRGQRTDPGRGAPPLHHLITLGHRCGVLLQGSQRRVDALHRPQEGLNHGLELSR